MVEIQIISQQEIDEVVAEQIETDANDGKYYSNRKKCSHPKLTKLSKSTGKCFYCRNYNTINYKRKSKIKNLYDMIEADTKHLTPDKKKSYMKILKSINPHNRMIQNV